MGMSETSDNIQIKIQMLNASQEHPASSINPFQTIEDRDVHCTFKAKKESQNVKHGCIRDQSPLQNQDQDTNPQAEYSKVPSHDLEAMDIICIFKIKIESHNFEHGCIKHQ